MYTGSDTPASGILRTCPHRITNTRPLSGSSSSQDLGTALSSPRPTEHPSVLYSLTVGQQHRRLTQRRAPAALLVRDPCRMPRATVVDCNVHAAHLAFWSTRGVALHIKPCVFRVTRNDDRVQRVRLERGSLRPVSFCYTTGLYLYMQKTVTNPENSGKNNLTPERKNFVAPPLIEILPTPSARRISGHLLRQRLQRNLERRSGTARRAREVAIFHSAAARIQRFLALYQRNRRTSYTSSASPSGANTFCSGTDAPNHWHVSSQLATCSVKHAYLQRPAHLHTRIRPTKHIAQPDSTQRAFATVPCLQSTPSTSLFF